MTLPLTLLVIIACACMDAVADPPASGVLLKDTTFITRLSDSSSSRVTAPAGAVVSIHARLRDGFLVSFGESEPRLLPSEALQLLDPPSVPGPQGPQSHREE